MKKPLNKHQIKSEATRTALLQAAEIIFARDGFERAQIDAIAKESGRTRGAVYAQFESKEQLFIALQSERIRQSALAFQAMLEGMDETDFDSRLAALKNYYSHETHAEAALLDLEVKLYALRHPESVDSLRESYSRIYPKGNFGKDFGISNEPGRSKIAHRILALGAIKSGLALAMKFQPDLLTGKEMQLLLSEVFQGLFPQQPAKPKAKRKAIKK